MGASTGPPALEGAVALAGVEHVYTGRSEDVRALAGVDLVVRPGQVASVVGPSGSGKTTLLRVLGGLLRPRRGEVRYGDVDIWSLSDRELSGLRNRSLGFVFQEVDLIQTLTVAQNVALPALIGGARHAEAMTCARDTLASFGLDPRADFYPSQLSGGEKRRAAVARALVNSPGFVLADEPTGDLDAESAARVEEELLGLAERGCGVVLVTHDPDLADRAGVRYRLTHGLLSER